MTSEETPTTAPLGEVAAVGLLDIGAQFADALRVSNDDILRARGGDISIYEQVLRDEQCYSTFKQLRTSIVARETRVEPGGTRPIDIAAAEDLKLQIERIGWDAVSRKMLSGLWYGYSVGECIYEANGTHVDLVAILVRKARRFRFDKDGNLRLVRIDNPQGSVMPSAKFWVLRADADDDDDPYPLGLGYYCYWPVWFKRNMMRFWSLWGEKFAQPTPVAKFPPGAKEPEQKKALSLAQKLLGGAAIAAPTNVMLELLEALARAGNDYHLFCEYMDLSVSKINLCQTMTTDNGSSKAQGSVHADVKIDVSKTYGDLQCESFRRGPATWLTNWNYPGAAVPRIFRDFDESEDLKNAAERDAQLVSVGYRPTPQRVQDIYGDGYVEITPTTGAGTNADPTTADPLAFAEHPQAPVVGPAEEGIDRLLATDGWEKVVGPDVEAILSFLDKVDNLETARERIAELAQRDPKAVTESLARVMFAAHIAGQVEADIDGE